MNSKNNKRIAKNTMMLYIRQILSLFVSLYTVRIVLDVLGVEDYGLYSVVGGVVSLLSFLSGSMASASQRFYSFALGQKNVEKLKTIFSVNLLIYVIIAVVSLILLEVIGLWFVNNRLEVPIERFDSVKFVYHISVLTFIVSILRTPFNSLIIANEDMSIYAYLSILEVSMKLGLVFLLIYITGDKLEIYVVLIFVSSLITTILYIFISVNKYKECQFRKFYFDKNILKEIVGFTGWTLFGQLTSVFRSQGVTILLNQYFSPVIVAARAIAVNITSSISAFSGNFNVSLYPPIIKSYAEGDLKNMFLLIYNGSKITFFLMWIFALPLILEMDIVLGLWLKNPPYEAVLFTRLALIEVLINSISSPIATAARAPGKMKSYELILGSIQVVIFFASWLIVFSGGDAYWVFVVAIIANLVMFFIRLIIVNSLIGIPLKQFYTQVFIPLIKVILFSFVPSYIVHVSLGEGLLFKFISIVLSVVFSITSMYWLGLDDYWREKIRKIVYNKFYNMLKRF